MERDQSKGRLLAAFLRRCDASKRRGFRLNRGGFEFLFLHRVDRFGSN